LCINCRYRKEQAEKEKLQSKDINMKDNNLKKIIGVIAGGIGAFFLIGSMAVQSEDLTIFSESIILVFLALIVFITFLSVLYLIEFSSRTKRNIFHLIFFLTYFAVIISNISEHSWMISNTYWNWAIEKVIEMWARTLTIDAPAAALINLLILGGVWWIVSKFWSDYKKDKEANKRAKEDDIK
jgi:hypothetical protein